MEKQNNLWGRFLQTGKIEDYLNYRLSKNQNGKTNNLNYNIDRNHIITEEYAELPK